MTAHGDGAARVRSRGAVLTCSPGAVLARLRGARPTRADGPERARVVGLTGPRLGGPAGGRPSGGSGPLSLGVPATVLVGRRIQERPGTTGRRTSVAAAGAAPERGSVTAELAVALPAVVLVLTAVLVLAASALTQLRCADAARAGARAAAIGDDESGVRAVVARVAGPDADVSVVRSGDWVTVSVSDAVVSGGLRTGPLVARASAVAWAEP